MSWITTTRTTLSNWQKRLGYSYLTDNSGNFITDNSGKFILVLTPGGETDSSNWIKRTKPN